MFNQENTLEDDLNPTSDHATKQCLSLACAFKVSMSIICVAVHFTMTQTGSKSIANKLGFEGVGEKIAFDILGFLASLAVGAFFYRALKTIDLKPKTKTQWGLGTLTPFAAAPAFTGSLLGARSMGLPEPVSITAALTLFTIKSSLTLDGSVKCPDYMSDMYTVLKAAYTDKQYSNLVRLSVSGLLSISFAAGVSDAIYEAFSTALNWTNLSSNFINYFAYTGTAIGCLGTLPFVLYWINRGVDELTSGNVFNDTITDKFTYWSVLLALPTLLLTLGETTEANDHALGRLGTAGTVIRTSSAIGYTMTIMMIGFSSALRDLASFQHDYNNRMPTNSEDALQSAGSNFDTKPLLKSSRFVWFNTETDIEGCKKQAYNDTLLKP